MQVFLSKLCGAYGSMHAKKKIATLKALSNKLKKLSLHYAKIFTDFPYFSRSFSA
jgi:hypothetical protein